MQKKYMFGGFIILVFMVLMGYLFTQTNISYEENFAQIKQTDKKIKATGAWVKEKGYKIDTEKNLFAFTIVDSKGTELNVVYKGAMPNNFESSTSVVVTGNYKPEGYFQATEILTKCPSKYEESYKEDAAKS